MTMAFKMVKPKKLDDEVVCRMQGELFMTKSWCRQAQYNEICHGCPENEGLAKSRFQLERDGVDHNHG